jgi:hypothetical protein
MNSVCQSFLVSRWILIRLLIALVGGWLFGQLVTARAPKNNFPQREQYSSPMKEKNAANRGIRSVAFLYSASTLPGPRANSNQPNRAGQVRTLPVKGKHTAFAGSCEKKITGPVAVAR